MRAAVRRPFFASLLLLGLACSAPGGGGEPQAAGTEDATRTVARVDGKEISVAELEAWIQEDWLEQQLEGKTPAQVHEFHTEYLERMIDERLLEQEARAQGVSVEELLGRQAGGVEVSDAEVKAFFDANRERLGGVSLEQIGPRIREHLEQRKAQEAMRNYVEGLRSEARVEMVLDAPRTEVAAVGPGLGPEDAPVTIVEFSDFQCPFCARAAPVVKQIRERFPESVRIVYRHFPLDSIHPQARTAAEASLCAADQGRFWEYHDLLFANARQLGEESLVGYAEQLGLDTDAFRACLEEDRHAAQVQADLEAGRRAGVTGTPSFFVNGRMLGGAQPLEAFVRVIESELAEQQATASSTTPAAPETKPASPSS